MNFQIKEWLIDEKESGEIMTYFNIVAATNENTVITEYISEQRTAEAYHISCELVLHRNEKAPCEKTQGAIL